MTLWVGTSGWQYASWKDVFYGGVPQRLWLERYAERFRVVEINNTFYRLPKEQTFVDWERRAPADFVFVPKLSRYLSHIKRLRDPEEPAELFMSRARRLRAKLGPLLLQLPPGFRREIARLDETLEAVTAAGRRHGAEVRIAVEFRDDSWYVDEVQAVLERHAAALCLPDRRNELLGPEWRTADWGYVRFHEGVASPRPCYGEARLRTWAERLAELYGDGGDVYAFFNNDPCACALRDATVFARAAERAGLRPTRVPETEVPLSC